MNYWTQSTDNIYVAAHRGWSDKYPENTMEAFKAAVELGVERVIESGCTLITCNNADVILDTLRKKGKHA